MGKDTDSAGDRKPIIEIDGVSFAYNGQTVLQDVNLTVYEREFVWIVGPNGGGKTTLMKIMLGLLAPARGSVKLLGVAPLEARSRIGYLPQHVDTDRQFPISVLEVALMGRLRRGMRWGPFPAEDTRVALDALQQVGLAELAERPAGELSGGQHRRLLIGRALAAQPELLLLDEPMANLDRQVEKELHELLQQLNKHLTIVMVSHDPAFVSDFVKQVVCVNRTVAVHPTSVMENEFVGELYGSGMRVVRHDQHDHHHSEDL
ncbi:MAG: metal ABC transporter ATP-binding protein [candidate division Zixibacteria bacterium]|nr:metal ABC transporter ATP-binding protein [candidate division Zixibacteria bacterium]